MSTILDSRVGYKPLHYEYAFKAYHRQKEVDWLPEEVTLSEDIKDFNDRCTPQERNLLKQLFRFFTQSDVDVANGYIDHYLPIFKHPELRMMMSTFASMEATHIHAYSLLLDTIGMPETEYEAFLEYKEMADKHEYIAGFKPSRYMKDGEFDKDNPEAQRELARSLAVYSGFTEGLQLFSSFAIMLNFPRHGKMRQMGQIISWSIRDESLHVEAMIRTFRELVQDYPHIWDSNLKNEISDICKKMVELEDRFIDLAFEQGGIEDLSAADVKQYIRFLADRRLQQLEINPVYGIEKNPLPWIGWITEGVEHANFFETRATEYSKGALVGNWGTDVWGAVKPRTHTLELDNDDVSAMIDQMNETQSPANKQSGAASPMQS